MSSFGATTSGAEVVAAFPQGVEGKTFVITGPSVSSLGAQTAIFLAQGQPANILLLGRTASKVDPVIEEIKNISPSTKVHFIQLDLTRFSSIETAPAEISKLVEKIDVLINNAGIMGLADYTLTPEGLEAQFGSNHIGHFLLTNLLMPKIVAAGPGARIVNLSSNGHQIGEVRFNDYNFSNGKEYNAWTAYAQSKTANILFTVRLAEKLGPKGISAFAVHPGVIWTNLGAHVPDKEWRVVGKMFADRGFAPAIGIKDLAQGTSCTLAAALDPSLESAYLNNCAPEETPEYANSPKNAQKLWELSEKIVGQKFEL